MKIALDVQTIGRQRGGDETYYRSLLQEFSTQNTGDDFSLFYTNRAAEPFLNTLGPRFAPHKLAQSSPWLRIPFAAPWELFKEKVDLYHTQYVGVRLPSVKLVLTVHDLSYEIYPNAFPWSRSFFLKGTRWSALSADRVIAVSMNTKRDLMRHYSIPDEKITVVHNGVAAHFSPRRSLGDAGRVRTHYRLDQPFILGMGGASPRKNTARLIDAFDALRREENSRLLLALVGTPDAETRKKIGDRTDVRILNHVPDADLPALYSAALCFVYPSLYEGFGLPVLEAMACGTAVACSNTSSLPEIAGDAALLFSPLEVDSMVKAIKVLINDKNQRDSFASRGLERARLFSWEKAARETLAVYHSLVEVPA